LDRAGTRGVQEFIAGIFSQIRCDQQLGKAGWRRIGRTGMLFKDAKLSVKAMGSSAIDGDAAYRLMLSRTLTALGE
jgi:hypothetical protein